MYKSTPYIEIFNFHVSDDFDNSYNELDVYGTCMKPGGLRIRWCYRDRYYWPIDPVDTLFTGEQ